MRLACNYVPIFSRFRAITIYLSKISVFRRFTHPSLMTQGFFWNLGFESWCKKLQSLCYRWWKVRDRTVISFETTPVCIDWVVWLTVCDVRLKLTNVTLQDAGLYTCEGFNVFGRQLTTGQLIVRRGLLIKIASKRKAHLYAVNGIRVSGRIFIVLVLN